MGFRAGFEEVEGVYEFGALAQDFHMLGWALDIQFSLSTISGYWNLRCASASFGLRLPKLHSSGIRTQVYIQMYFDLKSLLKASLSTKPHWGVV